MQKQQIIKVTKNKKHNRRDQQTYDIKCIFEKF